MILTDEIKNQLLEIIEKSKTTSELIARVENYEHDSKTERVPLIASI
jgi:hypothetical protein